MCRYLGFSLLGFERGFGDHLTCLSCATKVLDFVYSSETTLAEEANSNILRVALLVNNNLGWGWRSNFCVLSRQWWGVGPLLFIRHWFLFSWWRWWLLVMVDPTGIVDVGERVSFLLYRG